MKTVSVDVKYSGAADVENLCLEFVHRNFIIIMLVGLIYPGIFTEMLP